jgi:hypothetical protein
MTTNSSTGGYLQPTPAPAPLEGQALLRFFQQIIAGITGLSGSMVRPFWQTEPPNVPEQGNAWCAFKIARRPSDEYAFIGRLPYLPEDGADHLQRHEELNIATTFYDTGGSTGNDNSGGLADYYSALLRDGLSVPQNREPLFLAGMGLTKIGEEISVPEKVKNRWQYRVDFEFAVNRQIDRVYPVNTLVSADGTIYYDTGLPPQLWTAT